VLDINELSQMLKLQTTV